MPAFVSPSFRLVAAALVALKLWLVSAQPVFAIGLSAHDDRLFLRLANTLLDGQWLGAYNQLTLAKGPAFSAFIAATVATGIPLPLAQHLLYLLACWLVVRALRPLLPGDGWALGLFIALAWQPMAYQMPDLGRVVRQNLSTPCALLVFAGLVALHTRATAGPRRRLAWALLLGGAWGALWLTREESIWIVPGTGLLVAVAMVWTRRGGRSWRPFLTPVLAAVAAALLPITIVCAMNARNYGWWGTVEVKAPEFVAAYGALNRVQVGSSSPQITLTRAGREAVYGVSPAFAELRPHLEGDLGASWATHSARVTGRDPAEREFAGGWWMWALRDAVAAAGHAPDAGTALAFYQRLADEVNAAADAGTLPAGPRRDTLMPPWRSEYTTALVRELSGGFWQFATWARFSAHAPPSEGDVGTLRLFRDLTQWFLSPAAAAPELNTPTATTARGYRIAVLQFIGSVARWLCAGLLAVGLAAWVALIGRAMRGRVWPEYCWWLATAAGGSVFAIVLINVLVHVTSFPNVSPAAFAPAYPLGLLWAWTALVGFVAPQRMGNS